MTKASFSCGYSFCKKVLDYKLDALVLLGGFGIVKEPFLSTCRNGILSYHHGDMRKYRGQPPCFWELYNGEKNIGVTVQKLSERLDAGLPILERNIKIRDNDNLTSLRKRVFDLSENMMLEALLKVNSNKFKSKELNELGPVYTLPNLRQWFILKSKLIYRKLSSNNR